jgi:hypothetical protein
VELNFAGRRRNMAFDAVICVDAASLHFPAIHFGRAPRSERLVRVGPFLTRSGSRGVAQYMRVGKTYIALNRYRGNS